MSDDVRVGGEGVSVEPSTSSLRLALALSCGTGRPLVWSGFRRRTGGFEASDAELLRIFKALASAFVEGGDEGELEVRFAPESGGPGPFELELSGAAPLLPLLGAVCVSFAARGSEAEVVLSGSTHAGGGATYEVAASTWAHLLRRIGIGVELELLRAGFAPRGGGAIRLRVGARDPSARLAPLDLSAQREMESIRIVSAAARLPAHVQQRQAARARSGIQIAGVEPSVQLLKLRSANAGSVVAITGVVDGIPVTVSAVPARSRSAETAGEEAASELRMLVSTRAVLPPVLVEPLLLALAFVEGASTISTWRLPPETVAQAQLVRAFTGRSVEIDGKPGKPAKIRLLRSPK